MIAKHITGMVDALVESGLVPYKNSADVMEVLEKYWYNRDAVVYEGYILMNQYNLTERESRVLLHKIVERAGWGDNVKYEDINAWADMIKEERNE